MRQKALTHTMGSMTMGSSGAKLLNAVENAVPNAKHGTGDMEMQEMKAHPEHKPHEHV